MAVPRHSVRSRVHGRELGATAELRGGGGVCAADRDAGPRVRGGRGGGPREAKRGDALSRRPSSLFRHQCRVLGLSLDPGGPFTYRAGLRRLERTGFGMRVTLRGLSYQDGDPHGFLGMKKEREWKTGEMVMFTECIYPFSKCLLVSHCTRETTVKR